MRFQDIISDYLTDKGFKVSIPNGRGGKITFFIPNTGNHHYQLIPKNSIVELRRVNLKIRQGKNQFFYEPKIVPLLTIDIHNPNDTQAFYDWVEELMIKTKISRG